MPLPFIVLLALWAIWWVSWMLAAAWSKQSQAQLPMAEEARHRVLTIAGVVLLFAPLGSLGAVTTLYLPTTALVWTAAVVTLIGFGFAWWARISLGTLWSPNVARKEDHAIIERGPYALVRHPIYTGIILAAIATAVAKGTILAIAGAALLAVSFCVKARMEEQFLKKELGEDAYEAYRARVPMLVPFWPVG
jgi:protein-S-isoprenylcysteine O-methyltransferase Ste14